jgi:propionyl-CoA synthetase
MAEKGHMTEQFETLYRESLEDPESFWARAAEDIDWSKPYDKVLDRSDPPFYRWFTGGELNTCYNAVDRHVESGRGEQTALIYDSPVTGSCLRFSFAELQQQVATVAGALSDLGVGKGNTVVIYMPMVPEAVIAMLACSRIGAVHSVVFGGFAADELAIRIDDCQPSVVLSASCGVEPARIVEYKPLLDRALEIATHSPKTVVILQREQKRANLDPDRDVDWRDWVAGAEPVGCVAVGATDPLYILYTSGTTGRPKGVVRDNGGHAVALKWSMRAIYGVEPGETFWAASDIGWVVGHSYIVYGPLLNGNTTVLYEGKPVGTPDPGAFWQVIENHAVNVLFTAPTAIRAIKKEDKNGDFLATRQLEGFRTLFLAGERTDPATLRWAQSHLNVPVIDHWWQTETGWSICACCIGIADIPVREGSAGMPVPGVMVTALDGSGAEAARNDIGALAVRLPLPPGTFAGLWNAKERCRDTYYSRYPGFYDTADAGYIDDDGYVFVMSRTDDVINVSGHRLSTGAMEEVLAAHPDVAECAVFGVHDDLKGQLPIGLLVLNSGTDRPEQEIVSEVVSLIRDRIGPVAAFKTAAVVARLPKTRSGKILRGVMRRMADEDPWTMPATIDDPAILDEIQSALKTLSRRRSSDE